MTVTILSRDRGATLHCNYDGCTCALTTGQIQVRLLRTYAASVGWIRGLDPGSGSPETGGRRPNRSWDVCPAHAVDERYRRAERELARDRRRAERARPPTPEVLAERALRRRAKANAAAKARRARRKAAAAKHAALVAA